MPEKYSSDFAVARACLLAIAGCIFSFPALSASIDGSVQLALSEIKKEELPKAAEPAEPGAETKPADGTQNGPPSPDGPDAAPEQPVQAPAAPEDSSTGEQSSNPAMPNAKEGSPAPQVEYDVTKLPFPVQKMRELILTAAKSGSIEALRPLIGSGDDITMLSLTDIDGDPLAYLKSLAGDPDGQEILAILVDVLESGYVHIDAGTADELYVWPYFFAYPLDKLDAKQKVELFQIVTAGDYDEMKQFGTYVFYRLGITPKGRWRFFVTGD
jgi:hypothetical protein